MGVGVSLFLIAVGAILAFAVDAQVQGIDLNTVGVILMLVGGGGLLLSLLFWGSWGGYHRREVLVDRDTMPRRTIVERDV